jgi:hypothetical protein
MATVQDIDTVKLISDGTSVTSNSINVSAGLTNIFQNNSTTLVRINSIYICNTSDKVTDVQLYRSDRTASNTQKCFFVARLHPDETVLAVEKPCPVIIDKSEGLSLLGKIVAADSASNVTGTVQIFYNGEEFSDVG